MNEAFRGFSLAASADLSNYMHFRVCHQADKVAAQEAAANDEAKKNNEIAAAAAAKKTKNFYSSYISYSSYTYISTCCHICSFKKLI